MQGRAARAKDRALVQLIERRWMSVTKPVQATPGRGNERLHGRRQVTSSLPRSGALRGAVARPGEPDGRGRRPPNRFLRQPCRGASDRLPDRVRLHPNQEDRIDPGLLRVQGTAARLGRSPTSTRESRSRRLTRLCARPLHGAAKPWPTRPPLAETCCSLPAHLRQATQSSGRREGASAAMSWAHLHAGPPVPTQAVGRR